MFPLTKETFRGPCLAEDTFRDPFDKGNIS